MTSSNKIIVAAAGLTLLASSSAWAQGPQAASQASYQIGFAGSSLQVPVAYGARWGSIGFGAYAQGCECTDDNADGNFGLAFGLGDPDDYAALEITAVSSGLLGKSGSEDSFGESGSLGFKLHTNLPGYTAAAVGVVGTARWGGEGFKNGNESSVYAVVSKMIPLGQFASIVNLGLSDGFYSDIDESGASVFGSAAFYFTSQISLIGEYTGRFTNAAISIAPFKSQGLTITLGATNLSERYDSDTEFAGSVGYGFSFY